MALTLSAVLDDFIDSATAAAARQALGIYLNQASTQTITMSGAFTLGITLTGNTTVTLPTSGTVLTSASLISDLAATTSAQLAGKISDETGSGALVFANTPTLVTPTITGNATVGSVNKVTITQPATGSTLTIVDGGTLATAGAFAATLTFTAGTNVTFPITGTLATRAGAETFTNKTYDTAGAGNAFSINGLAATANTGTGSVVRAVSPTLTGTPALAAATATSLTASGLVTGATMGAIASTAFSGATLALSGAGTISCSDITATSIACASAVSGASLAILAGGGLKMAPSTYIADGAILTTNANAIITKAGVALMSVAAPSSIDGQELTIHNGSNNAHIITFTGSTLYDGTVGANLTATFAAFIGGAITVVASGSTWLVKSYHAVTIAP